MNLIVVLAAFLIAAFGMPTTNGTRKLAQRARKWKMIETWLTSESGKHRVAVYQSRVLRVRHARSGKFRIRRVVQQVLRTRCRTRKRKRRRTKVCQERWSKTSETWQVHVEKLPKGYKRLEHTGKVVLLHRGNVNSCGRRKFLKVSTKASRLISKYSKCKSTLAADATNTWWDSCRCEYENSVTGKEQCDMWSGMNVIKKLSCTQLTHDQLLTLGMSMSTMTNLNDLKIYDTADVSSILSEISSLIQLTHLTLTKCNLTAVPPEIVLLKNLEHIDLSYNNFNELPWAILQGSRGKFPYLASIKMIDNALSGLRFTAENVPRKLAYVNMAGNNFNAIPRSLKYATSLEELTLDWNPMKDKLDDLCNVRSLKTLSLKSTKLTALPSCISQLHNLEELYLSANLYIVGGLPDEIGELQRLKKLDVSRSRLSSLPSSISNLKALRKLFVFGNKLEQLPSTIGELGNLLELQAHDNDIKVVPETVGALGNLEILRLHRNRLKEVPEQLGNCMKLRELQLSSNVRITTLPVSLSRIPNLHIELYRTYFECLPQGWLLRPNQITIEPLGGSVPFCT